ncbi:DNA primase/helicase (plasmid) [Geminocystis sp. NIES-3708]|uniref:plasmid replication protein, CyRepA1 family n=1 Tax=Geminocystis sp. NIES-3708 TaxID=1615909 RepID=UPI0005FC4816|nr:plasmid replication protein, CyRepA1 family [Geminocystis sp. NIES-3708]BAQ63171.1 DNA primase/helicase [Geminocystis sp. NIES-3708]
MIIENGKFVAPPLKKIIASPEFAPSEQGSKPYGGLNQSNGQNFWSSQNLTMCQEILTKKRPLRTDISFSYCSELINKPVTNSDKAKTNFHSMSGNVDNIIDIFCKGFAVSPFHYTNNHRSSDNATVAGLLIVDIDNQEWVEPEIIDGNKPQNNNGHGDNNQNGNDNNEGKIVKQKVYKHQLTLEEYQSIDFCRKYTFAITTASHTETWHRFRVFMPLPMDIDKTTYEVAVRHLNAILKGAVDINATNPSIGFYGNSNGILYKADEFQALDYDWLSQLQPEVDKIKKKQEKQKRKLARKIAKNQKKLAKSATAKDIVEALSYIPCDDYDTWTKVGFALHHTFNGSDEGLEIYDNWSSQANNYDGRKAIEYKWLSFNKSRTDKPITIATVFKLAIDQGYKPPRKIRRRLEARDYFEDYKTFSYPISLECHKNYDKGEISQEIPADNLDYLKDEIKNINSSKKGYFPEEIIAQIPRQGLVFIQGDMGTGKTYLAEKIVAEFKAQGKYVLSPDSTRSLCQQSANRYGIYYKTHDDTTPIQNLRSQGIKTTYDSFAKYKDEAPDCIIFDEILSSENHLLLGDTELKHNREEVLYAVRNVVKNCIDKGGLVICLDEMLVDFCIDLMKDFAGGIEPFIIVNHYRNNNYETYQLLNPDEPKKILFTMPILGLKPFYCCDSQKEVISLYQELSKTFSDKVFKHIHQGNANLPENQELLKNPTLWLQQNKCDGLIVSPTIVCGFSIEGNFFDAVIGNFCGVLPVNQCRQMLRRIRSDIPRYVYASSHGLNYSNEFDFQEIADKAILKKKNKLDLLKLSSLIAKSTLPSEYIKVALSMMNPDTGKWENIELITQSKYIGFTNAGKANYRENIFNELRDSGSTIIYGYNYEEFMAEFVEVGFTEESLHEHSQKDFKTIIKTHNDERMNHQAVSISSGDTTGFDLDSAQYVLKNRHGINPETHLPLHSEEKIAGAQKFIYQDLFPTVELTLDFIKEYLLKDKTKLRTIERYFWFNNFSLLKKKETIKALNWLSNSRRFVYLEKDYDDLLLEIHLLKVLEVQKFIDLEGYFTRKDKCVKSFFKRALKHKQELRDYFNIIVTADSNPIIILKNLLKSIGIKLKSSVRKVNKVNTRVYLIDQSYLDDDIRQSVLTSYQMRNAGLKTVKGKMKKISEGFEENKNSETTINKGLVGDSNGYKNDSISYNNQANSVAGLKVTTKISTEGLKQGEIFQTERGIIEGNKNAKTVIKNEFEANNNSYENPSISYNNQTDSVVTQAQTQDDDKY